MTCSLSVLSDIREKEDLDAKKWRLESQFIHVMHSAVEPPATPVILHSNSAGRKRSCSSCPYRPPHSERDRLGGPTLSPCTSLPDLPLTDCYPEGLQTSPSLPGETGRGGRAAHYSRTRTVFTALPLTPQGRRCWRKFPHRKVQ